MDRARAAKQFGPAAERALEAWDIGARRVELVSLSENVVFRVDDPTDSYVLRIHRPGYHTLAELDSEQQWTRALSEAGVGAPVPVPTREGRGYVAVPIAGFDEPRWVGLSRWMEGTPLASRLASAEGRDIERHYESIGAIAAAIHNQATSWAPPAGFTRHALDTHGLMGETPFWGPFWKSPALTKPQRELLMRTRGRIFEALETYGKASETYGLIHADLHAGNILVDDEALRVIDFDDAGFGWHQYELAVSLYGHHREPDFQDYKDALVRGYRRGRPITDAALSLLPMFLLVRGLALIGWIDQRPELERGDFAKRLIEDVVPDCEAFVAAAG